MTQLVGVDWGTTNLRAFRLDAEGEVLESRSDPRGAGGLAPDQFPGVLRDVAGDWLAEASPVMICGMAGARAGWVEAPYVLCPAGPEDLAAHVVRPAEGVGVIPGVALSADGLGDVMRGEETQAVGLFGSGDSGVMVAPGTHSKWIAVRDGRIERFRTFATGELFAAVRTATLIGRGLPEPGLDDPAFDEGVRLALTDPAITAHLFSARVGQLSGRLDPQGASDFLSGLLLGAEIAAAPAERSASVVIVGGERLVGRYARGLALAGFTSVRVAHGETAAARGLHRIWSMMK